MCCNQAELIKSNQVASWHGGLRAPVFHLSHGRAVPRGWGWGPSSSNKLASSRHHPVLQEWIWFYPEKHFLFYCGGRSRWVFLNFNSIAHLGTCLVARGWSMYCRMFVSIPIGCLWHLFMSIVKTKNILDIVKYPLAEGGEPHCLQLRTLVQTWVSFIRVSFTSTINTDSSHWGSWEQRQTNKYQDSLAFITQVVSKSHGIETAKVKPQI